MSCTRFLFVNEVYIYIRSGKAVRAFKAFIDRCCRHPSVLNTILPHEVQRPWNAHSLTRLPLPGIHSLFLFFHIFFEKPFCFHEPFLQFLCLEIPRALACVRACAFECLLCNCMCVCKRIYKRFESYNELCEFEFCLWLVLSLLLLTFVRSDEAANCYKRGVTGI